MNETKKSAELAARRASAIRTAWVERNKACGDARTTLNPLEGWLLEHSKTLVAKTARTVRFSSDVRRVIANGGGRSLATSVDELASQLLAGKKLEVIVTEEQESGPMKRQYANLVFVSGVNLVADPSDLIVFKEWDAERASILILKEAIKLQTKIVSALTHSTMEKFSRTVSQARVETARELLGAIANVRRIVEPDQALAKGLEEDEIDALRPKPFPMRLLSSEAVQWLLDCVSEKIITQGELSGLDLETVSTEEPQPQEKQSWLDCAIG